MSQPAPDQKFTAALSDVVWRFHAYDQYDQQPQRAIEALMKRAPGFAAEFYREQFARHLRLLLATIEAVHEALSPLQPENKTSQYSDVDQEDVISKLRVAFPDMPEDFLTGYISMVIYWYYLR